MVILPTNNGEPNEKNIKHEMESRILWLSMEIQVCRCPNDVVDYHISAHGVSGANDWDKGYWV